jgi:hypothetical protein
VHEPADISAQAPDPDSGHGYIPPDLHPDHRAAFPESLRTACSRCGYDLADLPENAPACPECGTPIGKAWEEGRSSLLSIAAVAVSGLSLMGIGCTGGFSAVLAAPGLALGLWARSRALRGIDPPVSAVMALGAIIMSGIILAIGGVIVASLIAISLI